jgi:hypothetical protein
MLPPFGHRFRFGLRTLLAVMTLAAVASWGYWIGWPWWARYRFESVLCKLKAGVTQNEVVQIWNDGKTFSLTDSRLNTTITTISRPNGLYCVYPIFYGDWNGFTFDRPCARVEVFRLTHLPPFNSSVGNRKVDLVSDFLSFLSDPKGDKPFPYKFELIHADPPEPAPDAPK